MLTHTKQKMSESALWKDMKKNIGHLGHFSRVESHETSSGIPDVDFCINGTEGHIELKFGRNKAPKIRGSQGKWFKRRVEAGGNPWMFAHLVIDKTDYYVLYSGHIVANLTTERNTAIWVDRATKTWKGYRDWNEFVKHLTIRRRYD